MFLAKLIRSTSRTFNSFSISILISDGKTASTCFLECLSLTYLARPIDINGSANTKGPIIRNGEISPTTEGLEATKSAIGTSTLSFINHEKIL